MLLQGGEISKLKKVRISNGSKYFFFFKLGLFFINYARNGQAKSSQTKKCILYWTSKPQKAQLNWVKNYFENFIFVWRVQKWGDISFESLDCFRQPFQKYNNVQGPLFIYKTLKSKLLFQVINNANFWVIQIAFGCLQQPIAALEDIFSGFYKLNTYYSIVLTSE